MQLLNRKPFTQWIGTLTSQYHQYVKESKGYRCKIVEVGINNKTSKDIVIWVLISGIKKQIIPYNPKDLVNNDTMLCEFSPLDARAITFYAFQEEKYKNLIPPTYLICGQEFLDGETIFLYSEVDKVGLHKSKVSELYKDTIRLCGFNQVDLINIVSTAIQEQSQKDFL